MRRAIVVGGSLSGLCAAKALSQSFDEVLVLERDTYPDEIKPRPGASQSRHSHALLGRGLLELERMFPGFGETAQALGAKLYDAGSFMTQHRASGWRSSGPLGFDFLWSSRDLLERTLRECLRSEARVRVLQQTSVTSLRVVRESGLRVTGVHVRGASGSKELSADLVVDASGRNTHAPEWFAALGIEPPECERVDAHLGYASRLYKPPVPRPREIWWKGMMIESEPPHLPRAGAIFPIEGDRWLVTLAGFGDAAPPTDESGFVAFAKTLSKPAIARAIEVATPLSDVFGYRSLANVRRRYERWRNKPLGFVALGDAACCFNPIYGQGMSVCVMCAALLSDTLRDLGPEHADFETEFFRRQFSFTHDIWRIATAADFLWPGTDGRRPVPIPGLATYARWALDAANTDAKSARQIVPIFSLTAPIRHLFHPRVVLRVLLVTAKRAWRAYWDGEVRTPDLPPIPARSVDAETLAADLQATSPASAPQASSSMTCD